MKSALAKGLNAGLTINLIKEVLVHLYAYCGFPRSLQGINTFIAVLEARKAKGITDKVGKEATPVKSTASNYEQGKKVLETLTGSPEIEVFLKEHLFADLFTWDVLNYADREVITISALINLGGVEPMMQGHRGIALNIGITEPQLKQILSLIKANGGKKEAEAGKQVLSGLIKSRQK